MEIISNIIQVTLESFDFAYCIVVNVLTYIIIKIINERRNNKDISRWTKRLILLIIIFSTGVLYYVSGVDTKLILNSAILSPVFWSWILKPICSTLHIDYKDIDVFT